MSIRSTMLRFDASLRSAVRPRLGNTTYRTSLAFGAIAVTSGVLAANAESYASAFREIFNPLKQQQAELNHLVRTLPMGDTSLRSKGVELAWQFEKGLLQLGGAGTRNWSAAQQQELLSMGSVRQMEGHHIHDVSNHPRLQGEPDNISFLTRREHLEAHGGNWQNSTTGELVDRGRQMQGLWLRNELLAFGFATIIGFGVGIALSAFDKRLSVSERISYGLEGATFSAISYGAGRLAGVALSSVGIGGVMRMAGIGMATSVAGALYTYVRLLQSGRGHIQALGPAILQLGVSLGGVLISAVAAQLWGGPAGIVAGVAYAVVVMLLATYNRERMKELYTRLQRHEIALLTPGAGEVVLA